MLYVDDSILIGTIDEKLDNGLAEMLFRVQNVKGDVELVGHAAGIGHLVGRAAAIGDRRAVTARLAPQPHHHAHDLVALFDEQSRGLRSFLVDGELHEAVI